MSFITIDQHTDFEIETEFPHRIRKIGSDKFITVNYSNDYPRIALNGKSYQLHRLIALQFIPNDDVADKTFVDHINRIKTDYRIENLRWVSRSENDRNRTSHCGVVYEFVDEIPAEDEDDIIVVNDYGNHQFEFVYFYDDVFYYYNGVHYRILHINEMKPNGTLYVRATNTDGKQVKIYINKFKKMYDLM